jgi:AcrR family transcriptional regulator
MTTAATSSAGADTRGRVLETAARMFGERGYAATSFRDIAVELGITKAAVYYHFPSKEGLVSALVAPLFDAVEAAIDAPRGEPRALLARLQGAVVEAGPTLAVLSQDPSLAEAGVVIKSRVRGLADRTALVLAGPGASRTRLVRAHVALAGLFGGMHGLQQSSGGVAPSRRDLATILDAAVAALGGAQLPVVRDGRRRSSPT